MKKTIIALLALAGMAAAADSTSVAITLPGSDDYTWIAGSNANGIGTGASAEIVKKLAAAITSAGADQVGWYAGTGQAYGANDYGTDISISSSDTFSFKCRPALSGEYVALGVTLPVNADSITLSFDTTNKLGYSVWSYDDETKTASELIGLTYQSDAGSVSQTYNTDTVDASQLFVLWTANHPTGNAGGGATVTVSNIALSYTPAVPEPATATLSLLALCGLAARRRRH